MKPPKDTTTYEGELAKFWFDEHGILNIIANNKPRTLEKQKDTFSFIKDITSNKKVYVLLDATSTSPQTKATRDFTAKEMGSVFKSMAVISHSETGKFITNIFVTLKDQPIPIVLFKNAADARQWLLSLMKQEKETGQEPSNDNIVL